MFCVVKEEEENIMAILSMFYGIIVSMYYMDNKQYNTPHIHVSYQGDESTIRIPDGELIEGSIKSGKLK